jgi:hypothetical protein
MNEIENDDFPYEILVDSRAKVERMFPLKDKPDDTKFVRSVNEVQNRPMTQIFLFSELLLNHANYTFNYKG